MYVCDFFLSDYSFSMARVSVVIKRKPSIDSVWQPCYFTFYKNVTFTKVVVLQNVIPYKISGPCINWH
jgi:hypothetical protein